MPVIWTATAFTVQIMSVLNLICKFIILLLQQYIFLSLIFTLVFITSVQYTDMYTLFVFILFESRAVYYLKFEGKKLFECNSKTNREFASSGAFANSRSIDEAVGSSGPSSISSTASASSKQAVPGASSTAQPAAADAVPLDCRYSLQLLTAMRSLARVAALAPQLDFSEDVRKQCLILLAGVHRFYLMPGPAYDWSNALDSQIVRVYLIER